MLVKGRVNNMDENEFRLWTDSVWWYFELGDTNMCLYIPASIAEDEVKGLVLELLICGATNLECEVVGELSDEDDDLLICLN